MTYLRRQWNAQQEANYGHQQGDDGLVPDDPDCTDLIYDGCHQSLQQAELHGQEQKTRRHILYVV